MDISAREEHGCLVAVVRGRLDTVSAGEFELKMDGLMAGASRNVILDLSGLDYISSAGLRSILAFSRKVKGAGGGMALCGVAGLPREVLLLSHFETVFPLHASVEDAAKSL